MRGSRPLTASVLVAAFVSVVHARKTSWWTGSDASLSSDASLLSLDEDVHASAEIEDDQRQSEGISHAADALSGKTHTSEDEDMGETCGEGEPISMGNFALGMIPTVSTECEKHKPCGAGFMTDGDDHDKSPKNNKYWTSCDEKEPKATIELSKKKCIRQVRIWSRGDDSPQETDDIKAEVFVNGQWKPCGDGPSKGMKKQSSWTFECALKGQKVRVTKQAGTGKASIAELEVFIAEKPVKQWNSGAICTGDDLRKKYEDTDHFPCDNFHNKGKALCEGKYVSQKYGISNQCKYVDNGAGQFSCRTGPRCMLKR